MSEFLQHHHTALPPAGRLIGREQELEHLDGWLNGPAQLLTICGTGGSGKTALAAQLCRMVGDRLQALFCGLHNATTREQAVLSIARRLGIQTDATASPIETSMIVGQRLAAAGDCLLVLDNVEQLIGAGDIAAAIHDILSVAPRLKILTTSRERLRVDGEALLQLQPLPRAAAFSLFVERAQHVDASFEVNDSNAADIGALVEAVDRLPLGIEMAAPWMQALTPAGLLSRMQRGIGLLADERALTSDRHADLSAAIRWSWALLSVDERRVMRHLAAFFTASFKLDTVEHVLLEEGQDGSVITVLRGLCERGMLRTRRSDSDEVVFLTYQTVNAFVREHAEPLEPERFAECADRFVRLAWSHAERLMFEQPSRIWLSRHRSNIRRLLTTLDGHLPAVAAVCGLVLHQLAWKVGPIDEAESLTHTTIAHAEASGDAALRALAFRARAETSRVSREFDTASLMAAKALSIAEAEGDSHLIAKVAMSAALVARDCGDHLAFSTLAQRAIAAFESAADSRGQAMALLLAATGPALELAAEESLRYIAAAGTIEKRLMEPQLSGHVAHAYATWHISHGDLDEAVTFLRTAIGEFAAAGDVAEHARLLATLGATLHDAGHGSGGDAYIDEALSIASRLGSGPSGDAESEEEAAIRNVTSLLSATGDFSAAGITMGHVGALLVRRGELARARGAFEVGVTEAQEGGSSRLLMYFHTVLTCIQLVERNIEQALGHCQAAADALVGWRSPASATIEKIVGRLRSMCAYDLRPDTRAGAVAEVIETLEALAGDNPVLRTGTTTIVILLEMLEGGAPATDSVTIGPEATWIRIGAHEPISLSRLGAVRRILLALIEAAEDQPGSAVSLTQLFEIGWQGQQASPEAAAGRVYTALSRLRKLGLASHLRTRSDGWSLSLPSNVRFAPHPYSDEVTQSD